MQTQTPSMCGVSDVVSLSPQEGSAHTLRWAHRLSILLALFAWLLISFGGHVTTIDAGDTEPAWSLHFWHWFVSWSELDGGHFYEITHRQLGTVVGFLTLLLVGMLWFVEKRAWVRRLGYIVFALVAIQGLLGGLRVLVVSDPTVQQTAMDVTGVASATGVRVWFGMVHATLGLGLFALLVSLVSITSRRWFEPSVPASNRAIKVLRSAAWMTVVTLLLQVVLGASLRHVGWQAGIIAVHALIALWVAACVLWMAMVAYGLPAAATQVRRPSFVLVALVQVQILLGIFAFAMPQAGVRTLHHMVGALLLAGCVMLLFRVYHVLVPVTSDENA